MAAAIVRWVRGEDYGVETLVIDDESRDDVEEYLWPAWIGQRLPKGMMH